MECRGLRADRENGGAAFTLIELLVVVSVIVVMTGLAIPAFNAIRGGTDFTSEVYILARTFDEARAYAMANNTYVLVGIAELAATQSTTANPQVSGTGRVSMVVLASTAGTRPYRNLLNTNTLTPQNWQTTYGNGSAFAPVSQLISFQNLHLADLQSGTPPLPTTGNMARPAVSACYDVPNVSGTSATPIAWPLGTQLSGSPAAQYTFNKVIEFDPQGTARIISTANLTSIPYSIEIGLQPTNGATVSPPVTGSTGEIAAIQITGISGITHIYRP